MSSNEKEPTASKQPCDLQTDIERLRRQIVSLEEAHRESAEDIKILKKTVMNLVKRAGKFNTKMQQTDGWLEGLGQRVSGVEQKLKSI